MGRIVPLAVAMALTLAGCGNSPGTRAVTGGLLGAGAGAAIGSTQGSAGTGALIGGGLGAVGGAVTAR
jgi:osmotically inducible lipoprotein OsmB